MKETGRHPKVTARRQERCDPRGRGPLGAGVAGSLCDPFSSSALAAQSETLDQRTVTLDVDVLEVTQQAATLPYEQKQPTT